jgi:MinD superfamily P-loop ATPase
MVKNNKSRMYSGSFRNGKMVYGRLAPGEENSGKLVSLVREKAKQVAEENNLETIIIDGPPGIGCPVISAITGVDKVVIVTEPTISGLSDMQRALEIVKKFDKAAYVIINKYDVIGHLPFDPTIVKAMINGKSITEFNPKANISEEINIIWNIILNTN